MRRILVVVDTVTLVCGWAAAELVFRSAAGDAASPMINVLAFTIVGVGAGLFLMSASGLYRRRVCQVRSVELARIARVAAAMAVLAGLRARGFGGDVTLAAGAATGASLFVGLALERGFLREWIADRRAGGDFRAPVVVVGGGLDAFAAAEFLDAHPILGFDVLGVTGPSEPSPVGSRFPWLGDLEDTREAVAVTGATGVMIDGASLTGSQLNDAVRALSAKNLHIHVMSGLRGVDTRRITMSPMADETVLHVAPTRLERHQEIAKRALDIVLAGTTLAVGAPVFLLVAALVWLDDRGTVFFRQTRVGQDNQHFTIYKFRTMVGDAEQQLEKLQAANGRQGPLFKMAHDPRVTRVGRLLRATSLDELPQLWNVLRGSMSMVGPRPALPSEVVDFDDELSARTRVKPGITGLWQVEARDLASFDLYRRYDLLYVESWSIALDLAIVGRTMTATLVRSVRSLFDSDRLEREAAAAFE